MRDGNIFGLFGVFICDDGRVAVSMYGVSQITGNLEQRNNGGTRIYTLSMFTIESDKIKPGVRKELTTTFMECPNRDIYISATTNYGLFEINTLHHLHVVPDSRDILRLVQQPTMCIFRTSI